MHLLERERALKRERELKDGRRPHASLSVDAAAAPHVSLSVDAAATLAEARPISDRGGPVNTYFFT